MTYDQAQSARIGQRIGLENPGIRLVATTADVEAPYQGQLVFALGDGLKIYDGTIWTDITGAGGPGAGIILGFPVPALTWTGVHSFGQAVVDVTLVDSLGEQIGGDVSFPDANTAQATFQIAVAGYMLVQK